MDRCWPLPMHVEIIALSVFTTFPQSKCDISIPASTATVNLYGLLTANKSPSFAIAPLEKRPPLDQHALAIPGQFERLMRGQVTHAKFGKRMREPEAYC